MKKIIIGIGGLIFGFGLGLSTMTKQEVVLDFLSLNDFGLLLVMGVAILFSIIAFTIVPRFRKRSVLGAPFSFKDNPISKQIIIGAVLFGIGWGVSGICPGSAIASIGTGNYPILIGVLGMILGAYVSEAYILKYVFKKRN